jgi:taurine---2-oxoglutarate transaminase
VSVTLKGTSRVLTPWTAQGNRSVPTIVRGERSSLYDEHGKRYIDFSAGLVAVNLGHAHPTVVNAIAEQAAKICYVAPSLGNDTREQLAEAIVELAPWSEGGRVFFTAGGGEANEDAIKIARTVSGRHKILTGYRSFHGSAPGAGTLTGENRRWPNEPGIPGIVHFFAPFPYRSPFHTRDEAEETKRAIAHLEDVILYEGRDRIAAILIEPIVGSNGVVLYSDGYLRELRKVCDRYGILLIFDEVMTGFGRTGKPFASQRFDVTPDLFSFAKGVTSAYVPLGGVAVRESHASYFDETPLPCGHTFSGHPLAMAAGVAALQAYQDVFGRVSGVESALRERLLQLQMRHQSIGEVRGTGAFFALELVKDRDTREPLIEWQGKQTLNSFVADLLVRGLYIYSRFNTVIIAPPLIVENSEIDEAVEIFDAALTNLERSV